MPICARRRLAALKLSREAAREFALRFSWEASVDAFRDNILVAHGVKAQRRRPEALRSSRPSARLSQARSYRGPAHDASRPSADIARRARAHRRGGGADAAALFARSSPSGCRRASILKPECLQRTGSFKFRGAYNALSALDPAQRARGVVAVSSGNHAQGVAEAARLFGVPATIVMPSDAPAPKRLRTERSGARVVAYDRATEDRDAVVARVVEEVGGAFIHPFNDPYRDRRAGDGRARDRRGLRRSRHRAGHRGRSVQRRRA